MRVVLFGGIAALFVAASPSAAQANLINNGDFESHSNIVVPDGGAAVVFAGSDPIDSWEITGNSVDLVEDSYGAISHSSVDLLGTPGPGEISQAFSYETNTRYLLTFDLPHNPYATAGAPVAVDLFGSQYLFDGLQPLQRHSLTFTTGDTGGSILSFSSVGGDGYSGAVIDTVSLISAVPEPATWAMMLLGLGSVCAALRGNRKRHRLPQLA